MLLLLILFLILLFILLLFFLTFSAAPWERGEVSGLAVVGRMKTKSPSCNPQSDGL